MKCPECNSENSDNARFRGDCGTRLPSPEESPASPTKTLKAQKEELTTGRLWLGHLYAKSFYMLGKIYEKKERIRDARENYEKFLELWKDADPGIPEVADTKNRLASLQNQ